MKIAPNIIRKEGSRIILKYTQAQERESEAHCKNMNITKWHLIEFSCKLLCYKNVIVRHVNVVISAERRHPLQRINEQNTRIGV